MTLGDIEFFNITRNLSKDFLHDNSEFSLEENKKWFLEKKPDFYIIYNDLEKIGYFRTSNLSIKNKNIFIGADLHPNFRGNGYAYQAYKIFIPYIFEKYDLHKISLEVLNTNNVAFNLYKKLGFLYEGTKREEIFRNNLYIDSIIMSIIKEEYYQKNHA